MLVRDHMSAHVITVERSAALDEARALLRKHRIRQLPVMHRGRLAGIVTDRDLRAAPPSRKTVGDVMTAKPVVIRPAAPIDEAAHLLRTLKVGALPVVENKTLVGIITASDVLDAFIELSGVAEPTFHLVLTGVGSRDAKWRIRRIVAQHHGDLKWIYHDRQHRVHLRLKVGSVDDVVTALEAAGFNVTTLLAPARRRR